MSHNTIVLCQYCQKEFKYKQGLQRHLLKCQEKIAKDKGYRSFVATDKKLNFVSCPASKESGYKSTCSSCGLCSGTLGTKTNKSIEIILH